MEDFTENFYLEALLTPIEGESRAGVDLRRDTSPRSLYYRLRDARAEARQVERDMETPISDGQGPGPGAAAAIPQWRTVRDLALQALGMAKDLEVAAWLTEAMVRGAGLAGFTAGVKLMSGLVEGFWDELYPLPDDEGVYARVAPVAGLSGGSAGNGTLVQPLRRLTLFPRPSGGILEFWQYEQSERIAAAPDEEKRQQRIAAGAIPFDALVTEALESVKTDGALFARMRDAASEALEAWSSLGKLLDARAGADSPSTRGVADLLAKIMSVAKFLADKAPHSDPPAPAAPTDNVDAVDAAGVPARANLGSVSTREDALRGLLDIAEYFRRTEPLSPLSYTLQEAVRRSRLSWPQLLEEIVPDPSTRAGILTSLGIRPPSE